jgi:hypothetical protein
MRRSREFESHCARLKAEGYVAGRPPRLRWWAFVAYWLVLAFLALACFCTFGQGW